MRTILLVTIMLLTSLTLGMVTGHLLAQTLPVIHAGDPLYFEQDGPDVATVQAMTFHLFDNGVQVAPSWPGITCTQMGTLLTFTCKGLLPSTVQLGDRTLKVSTLQSGKSESFPSNTLSVHVDLPMTSQPRNLRITAQ